MTGMAHASEVDVSVTGVQSARGHIRVELCTKDTFLKDNCPYQGAAPATPGTTLVRIDGVPPGAYAAQVFDDDTDRGVVHANALGIPREAVGFSNDARLHAKGPRFSDAAFIVEDKVARITLRLRRIFRP